MGSWFSNLHIRTSETATRVAAEDWLLRYLQGQGYLPASAEEADGAVAVIDGGQWVTVCSDLLDFEDPNAVAELGRPLSEELHTDVLGIACFDSDYLYLNLINAPEKVNAWVGIGSAAGMGIRRRTGLAAWKKKVREFDTFSACARQKYVCAEEFLFEAADCLGLSPERSGASYEYLADLGLEEQAHILYVRLPEERKTKELPRLEQFTRSLMPGQIGKPQVVSAVNKGGESRGLAVYFIGPYVEHEELTFTETCFLFEKDGHFALKPFALSRVQLADGQWAYYYHDPGFRIPPKVDERLPMGKQLRLMGEREIHVRFVPQGDPRKTLDISVVLVPDKNFEGQTGWNVWESFGSKEAYIDHMNSRWADKRARSLPGTAPQELRREDFD